jgi:hypothetical protein
MCFCGGDELQAQRENVPVCKNVSTSMLKLVYAQREYVKLGEIYVP